MKFKRLFSPITINGMELKNRLIMPAMHNGYNEENGMPSARFNEFFWRRAEGGVGLIVCGGAFFDEYGIGGISMMNIADDAVIPGLKEFTDGCHKRGAKVGVQLYEAGRYAATNALNGVQQVAPSAVFSGYSRAMPRALEVDEIKHICDMAAKAAKRAVEAGFDMVEISGSAGYLICQFLSPLTNLRTDEYGGSWANRVRFAKEYVAAVRKAVGKNYPIFMRVAAHDLVPGSNTNKDAVRFAKEMEKAGVDCLNITGGWHESKVPQITGELPRAGWDFHIAAIADAVKIPVAASNRINDPTVAERLLATGVAEMISIGRPSIADPDWVKKAEAGRDDLIRKCLGCNQGCLGRAFFSEPVECTVNGQVGREYELKDKKNPPAKKILVIGGGISGSEFAIKAAEQGHKVTLWEKTDRIGGQLFLAGAAPNKQEFLYITDYYKNMLKELNVEVCLNKEATASDVKAGGFDMVVTAMGRGASPQIPIDNKDNLPVYMAYDVLTGDCMPGQNVLVIGGGAVGCETAQYMANEASVSPDQVFHMMIHEYDKMKEITSRLVTSRRKITVVDLVKIGQGFDAGTAWPVMKDLARLGVKTYGFTTVGEIKDGKATLTVKNVKEGGEKVIEVPVDSIVLAVGAKPNDGLYNELKEAGVNVYNIGDSVKVRNALIGVREACELAESLLV